MLVWGGGGEEEEGDAAFFKGAGYLSLLILIDSMDLSGGTNTKNESDFILSTIKSIAYRSGLELMTIRTTVMDSR